MTIGYKGECFCGSVKIEAQGEPEVMGFCHCTSCRTWLASPVHASSMWKSSAIQVITGREYIRTFQKTPESPSHRQFCARCGGHLMIEAPDWGMVDVCAAILPTLEFTPAAHVNYSESVLPMRDGLPKYRDFPEEYGGSGVVVSE